MANILNSFRSGAVGFIDWLDVLDHLELSSPSEPFLKRAVLKKTSQTNQIGQGKI